MFSSFGVKPPASGFQSYSYSSLKIAPSVTSRAVLSSLFIFASSVCKSLWCLTSTLTQGGEGSHLFRFTCSVVLWGGRNTGNKYHWHVWGVPSVYGPHWVCPSSQWRVLSRSTLLRLQRSLQGTVQSRPWVLCPSQVQAGQATRCLWAHCPRQAVRLNHLPNIGRSVSWCATRAPTQVCHVSLLAAVLRLQPSWWMSTI